MLRTLYLTAVLALCSFGLSAQTISGTITDENGEPMIGVNVIEKNTFNGTTTDFDGKYTLNLTSDAPTVVFRFVGYRDHEVNIDGQTTIDHQMQPDEIGLDAVVVSASKRKEKVIDAPASVTILGADKLERTVATTPIDHLNKVPGVDIMKTGIVSANVNIRGFNNIFSGAMLTVVDDRIARIPSLRVNAFQLIPTNNSDIASMEVVRGPASALYGPNAADGVLAIRTKSPLDQDYDFEVTTAFNTGFRARSFQRNLPRNFQGYQHNDNFGERVMWSPEMRVAGKLTEKIGFKVSGSYFKGNDFEYYDSREPLPEVDSVVLGSVQDGGSFEPETGPDGEADSTVFQRDFEIEKFNVDGRLDFRVTDDIEIVLNGGIARTSNIELTGLGAAQGINWRNYYGQARFTWRNLFAQYFVNGSNAGDTYLLPQDGRQQQKLVDKSKLHVIQLQHRSDQFKRTNDLDLIYGVDVLLTRPNTEGTINGRFEDDDNINQVGGYAQAEYKLNEKYIFLAALRVDYQDRISEVQFSPRAAFVYKPTPRHTLRATYNRAFSAPTSLNFSLDLLNATSPAGYGIRGIGNATGYQFQRDDGGNLIFQPNSLIGTPAAPRAWNDFSGNLNNNLFENYVLAIANQLASATGLDLFGQVLPLVNTLTAGIDVSGVGRAGVDLVDYVGSENPSTSVDGGSGVNLNNWEDRDAVESTITQTYELGYKGIIKNKLFLTADLYYTRIDNFTSPLTNVTPTVIFEEDEFISTISPTIQNNLDALETADPTTYNIVLGLLDGNADYGGTANGSALDEIQNVMAGINAQIGLGNVLTDDPANGNDLLISYVNLGMVDVFGFDIGATYIPMDELSINWAFSHVNKDRIPLAGAAGGFIGLNAPRWKTALGVDYDNQDIGIGASLNWRWQDAFPANSAVYIGDVFAHNFIDFGLRYSKDFIDGHTTTFGVDVTGFEGFLKDEWKFQPFPGTPFGNGLAMFRVQHHFGLNKKQRRAAAQ